MNLIKVISSFMATALVAGCASTGGVSGPRGPKLVASGHTTEYGQYAEVGVEFSSVGDFVAIVSPSRWKSPIATGGSLSWVNPMAWSDDAGRTGRILIGEAVIVGGVVVAAAGGGGGGSDGGGGTSGGPDLSGPEGSAPAPPPPAPLP
jgi:hypothetical protein